MKKVLMVISVLSISFMLASCATEPKTAVLRQLPSVSAEGDEASKYYMDALTQDTFREVEPIIQAMKPGDSIVSTGVEWRFYTIKEGSRQRNVAVADGWVNGLSGRYFGAVLGLGKFTGISKDFIYGEHVFGYVWGNVNLLPRYLVMTKAARVTKSEYEELEKKQSKNVGTFLVKMYGTKTTLYFHDVRVKEVKVLDRVSAPIEEVTIEEIGRVDINEYLKTLVTSQRYEEVEPKLKQHRIGSSIWDVKRSMGGKYSTYDLGRRYVLEMDGYLKPHMKKTDYVWGESSADGKFEVWPFGYLDNGVPIPQMALIFKNSKLHTIVENATKDRVVKKLAEIGLVN